MSNKYYKEDQLKESYVKDNSFNDITCEGKRLYVGVILYHYIYGELHITKVDRVKTKFNNFNYIEVKIAEPTSVSSTFKEKYGITTKDLEQATLTFREDSIKNWLFIDKDNVKIVNQDFCNRIFKVE